MNNGRTIEQHHKEASQAMALEAARILAVDAFKNDSDSWKAWDESHKAGSHPFPDSFTKKTSGGSGVNKSSTYDVPTREMLVKFDGDMIPTLGAGVTYKNTRIIWPAGTKMRTIGLDDIQRSIDKLPGNTATLIKTGIVLHAGQSPGERDYILSLGLNPDEYGGILNSTDGGQINVFYCDNTSGKGDQTAKELDKTMQHEVGHLLDKDEVISTSGLYKQAVNGDRTHMSGSTYEGYSSEYAQQYGSAHPEAPYKEDFAEAFKDYCTYKESGASAPPVGEAERFKVIEDMMKELKL